MFFKFFSICEIELCCSYCYFLNHHKNHKLIAIDDEESLKNENISIEDCIEEFNEYFEKLNNLKDKTENEMSNLDKLYDKADKDLKDSFEEKHLNLTKQENEIRERLQNEVTKIKEKLELYLSNNNNLIRSCEKIYKGIKALEKEEKQMIRILSYVSKINKNKKEMKELLEEEMKNLKIEFIKEETDIKYTEYYFNGFQCEVKDIEISELSLDKFKISWKFEQKNQNKLINNPENFNFQVELRKEDLNEVFKSVYEGKSSNCTINNLESNITYDVRIGIKYNNIIVSFSKIKQFKTKEVDSLILKDTQRANEFLKKIYEFNGNKKIELIYRGTRDGMNSNSFHNKCDNKGPTIILYKNDKDHIFGAYASIPWTNSGEWKSATGSYLFTLTNMHNTAPTKLPHSGKESAYSVYHHFENGPSFGSGRDISIAGDFTLGDSYANFPYTYVDNIGRGFSTFSRDLKSNRFKLKEIEVFKMI